MKKIIIILLLVLTSVSAKKTIIKVATLAPEGTAWHDILIDLGQRWKKATDGEVQVRIYPGGILGDDRDMVRKMRIGQIQAAALSTDVPIPYLLFSIINNIGKFQRAAILKLS